MDKIITLTYANGTVTELSGVEELTAVMPLIVSGVATVSVRDQVAAAAPEPAAVAPVVVAVAPAVHAAPLPDPTIPGLLVPAPTTVTRSRPRSVYVTENEINIMRVLRQFPDGITSAEVAELLDADPNHTSANISQLRTKRPYKDAGDPLVVPVTGGKFKVTVFGMRVKLIVAGRPMKPNRDIGWGP
jgi:hypothetical protein